MNPAPPVMRTVPATPREVSAVGEPALQSPVVLVQEDHAGSAAPTGHFRPRARPESRVPTLLGFTGGAVGLPPPPVTTLLGLPGGDCGFTDRGPAVPRLLGLTGGPAGLGPSECSAGLLLIAPISIPVRWSAIPCRAGPT